MSLPRATTTGERANSSRHTLRARARSMTTFRPSSTRMAVSSRDCLGSSRSSTRSTLPGATRLRLFSSRSTCSPTCGLTPASGLTRSGARPTTLPRSCPSSAQLAANCRTEVSSTRRSSKTSQSWKRGRSSRPLSSRTTVGRFSSRGTKRSSRGGTSSTLSSSRHSTSCPPKAATRYCSTS